MLQKVGNLVTKFPELGPTLRELFAQVRVILSIKKYIVFQDMIFGPKIRKIYLLLPHLGPVAVAQSSPRPEAPQVT